MKGAQTDEQYARQLQDEEMALASHQWRGPARDEYSSGRYAIGARAGGRGRPPPRHHGRSDAYSNGFRPTDRPKTFFSLLGFGAGARPRPVGMPVAQAVAVPVGGVPTVVAAEPARLSEDMRAAFVAEGYITLPGAVPSALCCEALKYINHHLGDGQSELSLVADRGTGFGTASSGHPSIINLFNHTSLGEVRTPGPPYI